MTFGLEPIMPAFGRDYKTLQEFERDLRKGLDFKCPSGQYCSIRDLEKLKLKEIAVRYNKRQSYGVIKL